MVGRGIGLNRLTPGTNSFVDPSPSMHVFVAVVYCSPALRCVHTAAVVAKSAGCENILLRVEPGLFENTDLYPDGRPTLLSPEALQKAGFPVDCDYKPFVPLEQVPLGRRLAPLTVLTGLVEAGVDCRLQRSRSQDARKGARHHHKSRFNDFRSGMDRI